MQKGIFIMVAVCAFLLGCNLYKGSESHADRKYQYIVVNYKDPSNLAKALNETAKNGYEYVNMADINSYAFIAKK